MQQPNKLLLQSQKFINNPWEGKIIDLQNEKELALTDFQLLANIIKRSAFLETIKLPAIKTDEIDQVIQILEKATAPNSTLLEITHDVCFVDYISAPVKPLWNAICSRLQRNNKRIFAIHGGGNIGLGLMADIISKSPFNYSTWATSSDSFTNNLINSNHCLWLQLKTQEGDEYSCVQQITMLNSKNHSHIKNLYIYANLAAICLTEIGFVNVARLIAQGLLARYKMDQAGLKILVLMNKPNCEVFVKEVIAEQLRQIDESIAEKVLETLEIIPTVVDRIVNRTPKEKIFTEMQTQLSAIDMKLQPDYGFLDPNQSFKEQIPTILSSVNKMSQLIPALGLRLPLFNVEKNFALYVPQHFVEAMRFTGMKKTKDLARLTDIKNKYLNGPHAILAWLGALLGYQKITDAINNRVLLQFIKPLMRLEIAPILQAEYNGLKTAELEALKSQFIDRCKANCEDPIKRVGRDPLRKLNRGGCVRGLIELKEKCKLTFAIPRLEWGIAAALLYAVKGIDANNKECQKIAEIYARRGSYQDVLCYNGTYAGNVYPGLDQQEDYLLVNRLMAKINLLEKIYDCDKEVRSDLFLAAINGSVTFNTLTQKNKYKKSKRAITQQQLGIQQR